MFSQDTKPHFVKPAELKNAFAEITLEISPNDTSTCAKISNRLLRKSTFKLSNGRQKKKICRIQEIVRGNIFSDEQFQDLRQDRTFLKFASHMALVTGRFLPTIASRLQINDQENVYLIKHFKKHYEFLKWLNISPNLIANYAHQFSPFRILTIVAQAERIFGKAKYAKKLRRTAVRMVISGGYKSVQHAKVCYGLDFRQSKEKFGKSQETAPIIRMAALLVFMKLYKTVDEAHCAYEKILQESREIFGADPNTSKLVRSAACEVFMKNYRSVAQAKAAYDQILAKTLSIFGQNPNTADVVRTAAYNCFIGRFKSVEKAKLHYDDTFASEPKVFDEKSNSFVKRRSRAVLSLAGANN